MKMTPRVVFLGSALILAAVAFVVVYLPYLTRHDAPSELYRSRSDE